MVFGLAFAAVLIAVALVVGRPGDEGVPLDPNSTKPLGTKAVVLLLRELGADVEITRSWSGSPTAGYDTALLLEDRFNDAQRADLQAWVDGGGVLVVADPTSPLVPPVASALGVDIGFGSGSHPRGECDIDALAGVERVDPAGGVAFEVPPGAQQCVATPSGAFVVAVPEGRGTVVAIGGPGVFVNTTLATFDNSVLAAALLAPTEGTRVAFVEPPRAGTGETTLVDLIDVRVKRLGVELLVAFVVYALWRARRLGRPVAEPQPVPIAGSELTEAVGGLLQQSRAPDRAASLLRADFRRFLGERLGVPATAPPTVLADAAASRLGIDPREVIALLEEQTVSSDADLVALAQSIDAIRQEVLHGQPAHR